MKNCAVFISVLLALTGGIQAEQDCRNPMGLYLPKEEFNLDACGWCYSYMPKLTKIFVKKWHAITNQKLIRQMNSSIHMPVVQLTNITHWAVANISDPDNYLWDSFQDDKARNLWKACCEAAAECCDSMIEQAVQDDTACPATWDGWQCWKETAAEVTAYVECPSHIFFQHDQPSCSKYAEKECEANGTWLRKKDKEWSDYTPCASEDVHKTRIYVHCAACSISIVALVPAIIIFFCYKQLSVPRISLHKNLFISLLFHSILIIMVKTLTMLKPLDSQGTSGIQEGAGCKLLHMLVKYFRMADYMWMFCEALFLHKLIATAFAEVKNMIMFYIIGWGIPVFFVGLYSGLRGGLYSDDDDPCWGTPREDLEWVVYGPCLLALCANVIFFANIMRVLMTKLRATHSREASQYRKAVRAALVLIPLFGCHYIFMVYRPTNTDCKWMELYIYFNYFTDGIQGFLVALLFCYINQEVRQLLVRSFHSVLEQRYPQYVRRRDSTFATRMTSLESSHFTREQSPPHDSTNKVVNHTNPGETIPLQTIPADS